MGLGGAERQLLNLAKELSKKHDVIVLTFYDLKEYLLTDSSQETYRLLSLKKRSRWHILGFLFRFLKIVLNEKPDVIYSFMSSASLVSLLARFARWPIGIVWGIRSSNMRLASYGRLPVLLRRLECRLSIFADLVISNSSAGRRQATADRFRNSKIIVVPNGINSEEFNKRKLLREKTRNSLKIPLDVSVIGTVARHDPMKGLEIFLESAKMHHKSIPSTHFLIIGSGPENYTESLKLYASSLGLQNRVIWMRKNENIAPYYNAMDIFSLTSIYGEGFSNAIAEAMLCELPCVVTDVGDSKEIVCGNGIVIPPGSPSSVAAAWTSLLDRPTLELRRLGIQSRKHIAANYSVQSMGEFTEIALKAVVTSVREKRREDEERRL